MNSRLLNFLLTAVVVLLSVTVTTPVWAKTIKLNYSIFFPASHVQCQAGMDWARSINEKSGGLVEITVFPGGTLTPAPQTYDSVVKGIADIGMSCFAYTLGRFPVMEAADLPLGYPNGTTASKAVNGFYAAVTPQELSDVKVLYLHAHGPGLLHTRKPVTSLDDLKGMKIRSTGLSARIVEALGAVPVAMSQGDTYESLNKGVVEGTFGPMEVLKGWRQGEVVKSTTECTAIGYTTTMFVVMNLDKWNSLPEEMKKLFEETSREWIDKHGQAWDEADAAGREYTLSLGNGIVPLSAEQTTLWNSKVQSVIDDYIASAAKKNLAGDTYVDTLRSLTYIDSMRSLLK